MTFEELKEEAKRQGYRLVKEEKKEPLLPCTCGCKRRESLIKQVPAVVPGSGKSEESSIWVEILRCEQCGRTAEGLTKKEARANWNKMIREIMEEEKSC